jgi:hypothetical protein
MTSREHARRLLLVLLSSERRDAQDRDEGPTGHRARNGGQGSGERGTHAAGDGREAGDDWRMWGSPLSVWGAPRLP